MPCHVASRQSHLVWLHLIKSHIRTFLGPCFLLQGAPLFPEQKDGRPGILEFAVSLLYLLLQPCHLRLLNHIPLPHNTPGEV